jgi:hypothetical protein
VSQPGRAELTGLRAVGPGVSHGTLDGFPTYLVNLQEVPFTPDTLPLHMVSRGRQERALAEFLVGHYRDYPRQLDLLSHLHLFALVEVLLMHNLTPEQLGFDPDAAALFVNTFCRGKFLQHCRTEDIIQELVRRLGKEKVLELLEQEGNMPPGKGESAPPPG